MKKILFLVVVLIAVGQLSAKGVEPKSPVGISVIKQGSLVKLFYKGEQSGKVKVTIYNEEGRVVYRETMANTENFMRPYDFSVLPFGTYIIELADAQGKRSQKVKHGLTRQSRAAHLTRLTKKESKYLLTVPNKGQDALTVRIYDDNSRIVYQKTEIVEGNFARVYNLNEISGDHLFEVTDKTGNVNRLIKPIR